MCCFRRTHSSLKWAPEASGIRSLSNTPGYRPGDTRACDFRPQILLASTRQKSDSSDAPGDTGSAKEQNLMDSVFFLTAEDKLARVEDRMEPPDGCVTFASERQLYELAQDLRFTSGRPGRHRKRKDSRGAPTRSPPKGPPTGIPGFRIRSGAMASMSTVSLTLGDSSQK
jgi:hypothetical protein